MKKIKCSAFYLGFILGFCLTPKGHGDLCTQDERFQFPFYLCCFHFENLLVKMAEILLLRWSSQNSIDKNRELCLVVERFPCTWITAIFEAPFVADQSDPETRKVPGTKKLIM